ncbi:hypothetical protein OFN63_34715, partial [Escherichia coli]|nr:hypothetical protein [Escherichia coli]
RRLWRWFLSLLDALFPDLAASLRAAGGMVAPALVTDVDGIVATYTDVTPAGDAARAAVAAWTARLEALTSVPPGAVTALVALLDAVG